MSINGYVSGDEIAKIVHCSVQNVSYHINRMKREGADIKVSHKGYKYDRDVEIKFAELKERFYLRGIRVEYIRSCLDLKNIRPHNANNQYIYYTSNEIGFFCKGSYGNLSFLTDASFKQDLPDWNVRFLSEYLREDVQLIKRDDCNYYLCNNFIIGKHISDGQRNHFQFILNNCARDEISEIKTAAMSEIMGDYIGIGGISLLIFEHLYVNLSSS